MKNTQRTIIFLISSIVLLNTINTQGMYRNSLVNRSPLTKKIKSAASQVTGLQTTAAATALAATAIASGSIPAITTAVTTFATGATATATTIAGILPMIDPMFAAGMLAGRAYMGGNLYFLRSKENSSKEQKSCELNCKVEQTQNCTNNEFTAYCLNPESKIDEVLDLEFQADDDTSNEKFSRHIDKETITKMAAYSIGILAAKVPIAITAPAFGSGFSCGVGGFLAYWFYQKHQLNQQQIGQEHLQNHTPKNMYELAALHNEQDDEQSETPKAKQEILQLSSNGNDDQKNK